MSNNPSPIVEAPRYWYVDVVDRNDLQKTKVTEFPEHLANDYYFLADNFFVDRLFDISGDGTQVIVSSKDLSDMELEPSPHLVVVWLPNTPEASFIIEDYPAHDVATIAFAPHDENQLLIFLKRGELHLYDLETRRGELLAVFDPPDFSFFSPNGRWLAYVNKQVDFIEMEPLLVQAGMKG